MATLFDENNSDEEGNLKINQSYADKYNQWREKEEYQKCIKKHKTFSKSSKNNIINCFLNLFQ